MPGVGGFQSYEIGGILEPPSSTIALGSFSSILKLEASRTPADP